MGLCRLKMFVLMLVWGCFVLIFINKIDNEFMFYQKFNFNFVYSIVDMMFIVNVYDKLKWYVFEMWLNVVFLLLFWKFVVFEFQMKVYIYNFVVEFIEGYWKNDKLFLCRVGFGFIYQQFICILFGCV